MMNSSRSASLKSTNALLRSGSSGAISRHVGMLVMLGTIGLLGIAANGQVSTDGFETWVEAVPTIPHYEGYIKNGWLGDKPPYLMPNIEFQMGPAKIFRREGTPGKEVISGKHAIGIETGKNPVNLLTNCRGIIGTRPIRREVSAWVRGKGTVRFRIYAYSQDNRCIDTPFLKTFEATPEWKQWKCWFEPNRTDIKTWFLVLEVGPNAAVDIDDLSAGAVTAATVTATMPAGVPPPVVDTEKIALAFPLNGTLQIDGKLDEAAWQTAEWHAGFLRHQNQASQTPVQAQFALLYDKDNLYLGFAAAEALDPRTIKATPPGQWPDGNPVEIFLDPGESRDVYYQLAANLLGNAYEARGMDASFDGTWKVLGNAEPGRWVLEVMIPFAMFNRATPQPGEQWSLNLCRNGVYMGPWAPVGPNYHRPAGFGLLVFGTYAGSWRDGFLPWAEKTITALKGNAGVMADPALAVQIGRSDTMLAALRAQAEKSGVDKLDRSSFLELYQGARPVRTMLTNLQHEWNWVQALSQK